jgi:hypothetical protein
MSVIGKFVFGPIRVALDPKKLDFKRADIEVHGLEQAGPSFEGRVFLNNPNADLNTALTRENGYAGSFHVYGYGIWPGDLGKEGEARTAKSDEVRAPIHKTVIATEAIREAARKGQDVTITIIPVYPGNPPTNASDALKLDEVKITIH